ncbi:MAG: aldolase/citrate lyase family protein [Eubacteriales bacterium]|nr:aldolase/citrate lyase family protein [Eubacteriales bacterium]
MELKQRLHEGEIVCGIMLSEIYTPNIVRILANCGYDFLLVDCEHGCFDMSQVSNLVSVAEGHGLDVLVRVTTDSISSVTKYMDMGARGILLSNTENAREAEALVKRCLYAPQGDRGVSTFRAHTNYCSTDLVDIMRHANERNIVIAQIESAQAVENLDAICGIDGVDGVLIGPNDLTQHMGIIGKYDHPEVRRLINTVREVTARHHKWSGIITGNLPLIEYCAGIGMTCFSVGSELNALASGAKTKYCQSMRILKKEEET